MSSLQIYFYLNLCLLQYVFRHLILTSNYNVLDEKWWFYPNWENYINMISFGFDDFLQTFEYLLILNYIFSNYISISNFLYFFVSLLLYRQPFFDHLIYLIPWVSSLVNIWRNYYIHHTPFRHSSQRSFKLELQHVHSNLVHIVTMKA